MPETFPVFFHEKEVRSNTSQRSAAYVWPGSDWDDFGYKINFQCRIFIVEAAGSETVFDTQLKLGFSDSDSDPRRLLLDLPKEGKRFVPIPEGFFTMLPELRDYRRIVKRLGVDTAALALQSLHDLVVNRQPNDLGSSWFKKATQTQVFLQAFLRTSETFFAYHNAGSVLDGLEFETFGSISSALAVKFRLETFSNDHELQLEFANGGDLPRNLAVLIGKNGAGKSQTLYKIAESLLSGNNTVRDVHGDRPHINRLVAIAPVSMARHTYPPAPKRPRIIYRHITIGKGLMSRSSATLSETIQRLVYSQDDIGNVSRWNLFLDGIASISPGMALGIKTRERPGAPLRVEPLYAFGSLAGRDAILRLLNIPRGQEVVRMVNGVGFPLSMGENTFTRFAAQLCLEIENGTLLLLDEPETHLHPNLITQFAALLNKLLVATGSYAIAATHSPFLVREVPRMQVHVLKRIGDEFSTEPIRLRTLGADVGSISEFVFGDELRDSLLVRIAMQIQSRPGTSEEELAKLAGELPNELLMQLRRRLGITSDDSPTPPQQSESRER